MVVRTLGHYEIIKPLGAGGMGEVYRAHDTTLKRDVAIKVLPEDLSADVERLARLKREAHLLAALNHPGIAAIYSLEESGDTHFLVLELVEGETLAQRLESGPLAEGAALDLASQLAEALEVAHDSGIVHRDVKPANVKVTPQGRAKLLDLGLAKSSRLEPAEDDLAESPTRTVGETKTGVIRGTAAYMSPEQARGLAPDQRTDIWAFGCVLYEMLAARQAFEGLTFSESVASVLRDDPEWSALPEDTPASILSLLRRCLEKDPRERLQHIGEARVEIDSVLETSGTGPSTSVRQPGSARSTGRHWMPWAAAAVLVVLLAVVIASYANLRWPGQVGGTAEQAPIRSLAVLPLASLSDDPEQEFFADGMTDALIADLAKIGSLRVISRTSVLRYKGTKTPIPEIAAELGVDALIEGTVLRADDGVRITVQLIDGRSDDNLWAESYNRELRGVLALQSEVAGAIAEEIEITLTADESARLAGAEEVDPEAYELYLRGRYQGDKYTVDGFEKSIENFNRAIELAPDFSLAYIGLAETYATVGMMYLPPADASAKIHESIQNALELDASLDEAHRLRAMLAMTEMDWALALAEAKRAVELNPSNAAAHDIYSATLLALGRLDEAVAADESATQLDPLSHLHNCNGGWTYYRARQYDRSVEQARRTVDLFDAFCPYEHLWIGSSFVQTGRFEEAIEELQNARAVEENIRVVAELGYAYAVAGREDEAEQVLRDLEELGQTQYVDPYWVAPIHIALGRTDAAFSLLDGSVEQGSFMPRWMVSDPRLDPIREDPRYADLLRRMNLPRTVHSR